MEASGVPTLQEIESQLTGPGGPFEIVEEPVLGESMAVFKDRPRSLRELLERSADLGDREYVVFDDWRLDFEGHRREVASLAAALRDRYGVGPGDRVAILAANCPEWILSFWATVSLGAVCVGLNGWWVRDEIRFGVEDAQPRLLLGDRRRLARIAGWDPGIPVVEFESAFAALRAHDPEASLPDVPIAEDDPATILYTSGTTGRPKGAVNTHRNIVALTRVQICHGLRSAVYQASKGAPPPSGDGQSVALVTTPLFHVSGLYSGVVTPMATGLKTVWTRGRFDAGRVLELIERERVTTWGPTGTMLHRVFDHPDLDRFDLSSVTHVGSGGAPVPAELQDRMRKVFPNARRNLGVGYGLTESTALATLNTGEDLELYPDSVGRPLPTVEVEVRDADGRPVPEGVEGEIHVRSPLVMKEYWHRPEATAETLRPGRWLRTGDVGCLENGRLYVHSRARDLILRGGENVYPAEVERRLEAHPAVVEAAVIGVDHPELGQEVKAVVVVDPSRGAPDEEALRAWAAEALAYFKVPTHWEVRAEPLPRNATGKVVKAVLRGEMAQTFQEEDGEAG
jgi:acyl-CoA synthetase (AMP-forming)/AMP-acid ligase II